MEAFQTIFDEEKHNKLMERGERKLSHRALWGAIMIWLNRDEPRFHLPYQLLSLLIDLDTLINRWRCELTKKLMYRFRIISSFFLKIIMHC